MRVSTNVTKRALFTSDERDMLRRAAYADGAERHIDDSTDYRAAALKRARAKALQGDTQHGRGNAYTRIELEAMAEAVGHAVECGVFTEEEYEAASTLHDALRQAARDLNIAASNASRTDNEHRKDYDPRTRESLK